MWWARAVRIVAGPAYLVSLAASAEVATDGTIGRKVTLRGKEVEIAADLGRIRGKNLFHSFERFGVERHGRVTFTGPDGLDNVISRVTGGEASSIEGTLRSTVAGANVWLINPAGMVFGPNARLDVKGSFHASTADELRFEDGATFSAKAPDNGVLSVASPEVFGFLRAPAAIVAERSILEVPQGEAISLAGGDIEIKGTTAGLPPPDLSVGGTTRTRGDPTRAGTVRAPAGLVTLSALDGPGTANVTTGEVAGAAAGRVHLTDAALVSTSGDGGGSVRIQAGRLVIRRASQIFAGNTGATDSAGGVTVKSDAMTLASGSSISANAYSAGRAGDVTVRTGELLVSADGSEYLTGIASDAEAGASGDGGAVSVSARSIELRNGAIVRSETLGTGDAGTVDVQADRLFISGNASFQPFYPYATGITGVADTGSSGKGATVTVAARDLQIFGSGGLIDSSSFGEGGGGDVVLTVGRVLIAGDPASMFATGVVSKTFPPSIGDAGNVTIAADELEMRLGGEISSATNADGNAGDVTVNAGLLRVAGDPAKGGDLIPRLGLTNVTISSDTYATATGHAGTVRVTAGELEVLDGGSISSSSFGTGTAGDVQVRASRVRVRDEGLIRSSGQGTGAAGDVRITAGNLKVDGGTIGTAGTGAEGGRIRILADEIISLHDGEVSSNGIEPQAGASLITLEAPLIALNSSRVTSLTGTGEPLTGSGEARLLGDVTVISVDSEVAASSTVEVTGLEAELGSRLVLPEGAFLEASALLQQSCAARRTEGLSTFTGAGRGGLPDNPERPLAARYVELGGAPAPPPQVASIDCGSLSRGIGGRDPR